MTSLKDQWILTHENQALLNRQDIQVLFKAPSKNNRTLFDIMALLRHHPIPYKVFADVTREEADNILTKLQKGESV